MARHFEYDLNQARSAQQSLGIKMASYTNGPNLDSIGNRIEQQSSASNRGGKERPLISNDRSPSGGRDDRDQAAARAAMRGINIGRTVNLKPPGGDSHITGQVGSESRRTKAKDWKDPGSDSVPNQGTAITKFTRLAVPIVRDIRAETSDGVTSFHFSHETISKTRTERVSDTGRRTRPGSAKNHANYIERDGAVARTIGEPAEDGKALEKIAAEKAKGLRPNSEEKILADVAVKSGKAAIGGIYIERQEAIAHETDGAAILYTNIDADPFERRKFWELVETHEKNPGEDAMRIHVASNPELWLDVMSDPDCPKTVTKNIEAADPMLEIRVQTKDNDLIRKLMRRHGWKPPKRRKTKGLSQEEQAAVEFQQGKTDGIVFEDARGGRIQCRIIGELPHEVSHEARVRILRGFAQEFERRDIPYVAVMHAPDHTNNDKNWHFHLIYYDRPAKRFTGAAADHIKPLRPNATDYVRRQHDIARKAISDKEVIAQVGQWDFTVKATYRQKCRHVQTAYPFAQDKLRECNKNDFIPKLRKVLADITNEEFKLAGHRRRLDPHKHSDMGIERQSDEHLGTRAAQLEASGISTNIGRQNERNQWAYQMTQIRRYQDSEEVKLRGDVAQMRRVTPAIVNNEPRSDLIKSHIDRYEQLRRAAIEHEVIGRTIQENIDRAASRANRIKFTCEKHLKAIGAKKASKGQIRHKSDYEAKLKEAVTHLDGLKVMFAHETLQINRSMEQAKLLHIEAAELQAEHGKLVKEAQAERSSGSPQAVGLETRSSATSSNDVDQRAETGDEDAGVLTNKQIDAFVATVIDENIRLVIRDRKVVPAVQDPRFAGVVTAPNYASCQPRLRVIRRNQNEAIKDLLEILSNRPDAIGTITRPDGKIIVKLKINDKRLQAALYSYQNDRDVSQAIKSAIALQQPSQSLPAEVSEAPSSTVTPSVSTESLIKPPENASPHQDVVHRALLERTLSDFCWLESNGKSSLLLSDASAKRLGVPTRIEIAADVVPVFDQITVAVAHEQFRLSKFIESSKVNVRFTPSGMVLPAYADQELQDIAAKHSRDPECCKVYASIQKLADEWDEAILRFGFLRGRRNVGDEILRLANRILEDDAAMARVRISGPMLKIELLTTRQYYLAQAPQPQENAGLRDNQTQLKNVRKQMDAGASKQSPEAQQAPIHEAATSHNELVRAWAKAMSSGDKNIIQHKAQLVRNDDEAERVARALDPSIMKAIISDAPNRHMPDAPSVSGRSIGTMMDRDFGIEPD